jgi:Flp pilus assembly pilin Flp
MLLKLGRKGQSLIEYLIIVAILGAGSLGIMRVLGHTLQAKFAGITNALQGERASQDPIEFEKVEKRHWEKKDMGDFLNGAQKGK